MDNAGLAALDQDVGNDFADLQALRHHIAVNPNAPAALVRVFAFDDAVAVAAPVLSRSTVIAESDLVENAGTQSQGHLYAIAQRLEISEVVTDILIERGEPGVVHAVAKNAGARISDDSFLELVARAGDDAQLALHVGTRRDIPRHHFLKLIETASASVCRKIVAANSKYADAVQGVITEVIDDINLEVRNKSRDHGLLKILRARGGMNTGFAEFRPILEPPDLGLGPGGFRDNSNCR
jgi:hypothetical protein